MMGADDSNIETTGQRHYRRAFLVSLHAYIYTSAKDITTPCTDIPNLAIS